MMMIGALRRLFGTVTPDEVFRRATRNDVRFFDSLYVPLAARALTEGGIQLVVFSQQKPVAQLDADHAIVVLMSPRPRVFGSEVGTSVSTGETNHFLVEIDPYAEGFATRMGNHGTIELPADPDGIARALAAAALRIVGGPAAAPTQSAEDRLALAQAALGRNDHKAAFVELQAVAQLAATQPRPAMLAMGQLARLFHQMGDPKNALVMLDTALRLAAMAAPEHRGTLLVDRARIFDDLGDPATAATWQEAAQLVAPRDIQLICHGHAAGAAIRAGAPNGHALAAAAVHQLGATPEPALLSIVLAAIGRSAGPHDVGYLAQAAWVVWHAQGALTPATLGGLGLLVERIGPATAIGLRVATIAMMCTFMVEPKPDDPALIRQTHALLERVGAARNLPLQGVLELIARDDNAVAAIDGALQNLASQTPWLVSLPAG